MDQIGDKKFKTKQLKKLQVKRRKRAQDTLDTEWLPVPGVEINVDDPFKQNCELLHYLNINYISMNIYNFNVYAFSCFAFKLLTKRHWKAQKETDAHLEMT